MALAYGRAVFGALIVAVAGASISAALSQTREQIDSCEQIGISSSPDLAISGCNAMIQSGRWSGNDLALVFRRRGHAYGFKNQFDRAITDFDEAIRLNPRDAFAFSLRGGVFYGKGQFDRAIADYDDAIRLDATYADNFRRRGIAYFFVSNYSAAASDFAHAVQLSPTYAFPALWLYLARARSESQKNATTELESIATKLTRPAWCFPIIELFLGRQTVEATLAVAANATNRCQTLFYVSEWHLQQNNREAAVRALKAATGTCPKTLVEYIGAQAELKRLGQ